MAKKLKTTVIASPDFRDADYDKPLKPFESAYLLHLEKQRLARESENNVDYSEQCDLTNESEYSRKSTRPSSNYTKDPLEPVVTLSVEEIKSNSLMIYDCVYKMLHKDYTVNSFTPLVSQIVQYYLCNKKLSEKQKSVIVNHFR